MGKLEKDWIKYPVIHLDLNAKKFDTVDDLIRLVDRQLLVYEAQYGSCSKDETIDDRFVTLIRMAAEKTGEHQVTVSFDIENTGKMDASEVAQVYVHDVQSSVPRPLKELKGYEKVFLKKGEKKRVSVVLDEDAFSFYDMNQHRFVVEKGDFEILVGPASSQLPLKAMVEL